MRRSGARRIGLPLIGVLLLGILSVVASYRYWAVLRYHFSTVTEGQVYRSGAMPPEMLQTIVRRYGIRAVVDLRDPGEEVDAEHAALARVGVKHLHVPSDQVPGDETVRAFLEIMDHREYRPVLIHCKHGTGRAVLFAAIYRMEYEGWSNERARRASRLLPFFGSFSSKRRKGLFIHDYVPRLRRTSEGKLNHWLWHGATMASMKYRSTSCVIIFPSYESGSKHLRGYDAGLSSFS
ncbi:MAG: tyrosine-protein phosphatase [Thermodesulfobacteriota bacterium]